MSKLKRKLKVGQIWGVLPLEKTLDVRRISYDGVYVFEYIDIGGVAKKIPTASFQAWITRKKAVLIGYYDFKTGKAIAKK